MIVMRVTCPCGHEFTLGQETWGRHGKCPDCDRILHIPRPTPDGKITHLQCGQCGATNSIPPNAVRTECRCGVSYVVPRLVKAEHKSMEQPKEAESGEASRPTARQPAEPTEAAAMPTEIGTDVPQPSDTTTSNEAASTPLPATTTTVPPAAPPDIPPPVPSTEAFSDVPPPAPPAGAFSDVPPPPSGEFRTTPPPPPDSGEMSDAPVSSTAGTPPQPPSSLPPESSSPPPLPTSRTARRRKMNPKVVGAGVAILLAAVAGIYVLLTASPTEAPVDLVTVDGNWEADLTTRQEMLRVVVRVTNNRDQSVRVKPVILDLVDGPGDALVGDVDSNDAQSLSDFFSALVDEMTKSSPAGVEDTDQEDVETYHIQLAVSSQDQWQTVRQWRQADRDGVERTLTGLLGESSGVVIPAGETVALRGIVAEWVRGGFNMSQRPDVPEAARIRLAEADSNKVLSEQLVMSSEDVRTAWIAEPEQTDRLAQTPSQLLEAQRERTMADPLDRGVPAALQASDIARLEADPELLRRFSQHSLVTDAEQRPQLWKPLAFDIFSSTTDVTTAQRAFVLVCQLKPEVTNEQLARQCTQGPLRNTLDEVITSLLEHQWSDKYEMIPQVLEAAGGIQLDSVTNEQLADCLSAVPAAGRRLAQHLLVFGTEAQVAWVVQSAADDTLDLGELDLMTHLQSGIRLGNERFLTHLLTTSHEDCLQAAEQMLDSFAEDLDPDAVDLNTASPAALGSVGLHDRLVSLKWRGMRAGQAWSLHQVLGEALPGQLAAIEDDRMEQAAYLEAMRRVWPTNDQTLLKLDANPLRQRLHEYGILRGKGLEQIAKNTKILDTTVALAEEWSPQDVAQGLRPLQEHVEKLHDWYQLAAKLAKLTDIVHGEAEQGRNELQIPDKVAQNVQDIVARIAALENELQESDIAIDDIAALIPGYPRLLSQQYFPAEVGNTWTYETTGADVTSTVFGKEEIGTTECLVLQQSNARGNFALYVAFSENEVKVYRQMNMDGYVLDYRPAFTHVKFGTRKEDEWFTAAKVQKRDPMNRRGDDALLKFSYSNLGIEIVSVPWAPDGVEAFRIQQRIIQEDQIIDETTFWLAKEVGVIKTQSGREGAGGSWSLKDFATRERP